jgi:hypothetical protein
MAQYIDEDKRGLVNQALSLSSDSGQTKVVELVVRVTPQWLGGFFDGEGCVRCIKSGSRGSSVHVQITQRDSTILAFIAYMYSGNLNGPYRKVTPLGKISSITEVNWTSKRGIRTFLSLIKDFVVIKRPQVEAALEMIEYIPDSGDNLYMVPPSEESQRRREELANVIRECNRKVFDAE